MNDQYGNKVPDDLVLVYDMDFTPDEITLIDSADWYVVNLFHNESLLCVSAKAVDYLFDGSPVEEFNSKIKSVDYVDRILHRYSEEDGFYHA